jgi:hypothetical protein
MTPDEVFFETVIESLRSLECEWQGKAEAADARADAVRDRGYDAAAASEAHTYRLCIKLISNRRDRFSGLYERLLHEPQQAPFHFARELSQLLNRHSAENASNTPDFILAEFLLTCLNAWNTGWQAKEKHYKSMQQEAPIPESEFIDRPTMQPVGAATLIRSMQLPPRMDTEHARTQPENDAVLDKRDKSE